MHTTTYLSYQASLNGYGKRAKRTKRSAEMLNGFPINRLRILGPEKTGTLWYETVPARTNRYEPVQTGTNWYIWERFGTLASSGMHPQNAAREAGKR